MPTDINNPSNAKLNENKWADGMQYLNADDTTSSKINSSIETMLSKMFGDNKKLFSNRSPFKIILNAIKEIQKLNFFWVAESINEHNILLAENVESVQGIAAIHGFHRNRGVASTGLTTIHIDSTLVSVTESTVLEVRNFAQVKNKKNGLIYTVFLRQDAYFVDFSSGVDFELFLKQGTISTSIHIGDGNPGAIAEISSGKKISENSVSVVLNSNNTELDLVKLKREALLSNNTCIIRNGFDGNVLLYFGDANSGYVPKLGESISIKWLDTDGISGNTLTNTDFEIISGFYIDGESIKSSKEISIRAKHDFVSGYDGDTLTDVRMNTGEQSTTSVIATPNQVKAYLRQYPKFSVSDVWRIPQTSSIHALLTPNLTLLTTGRSYFDIDYSEFITTEADKTAILDSIYNDEANVLVSTIKFEEYLIAEFAILILIKVADRTVISDGLKKRIRTATSDALVQAFVKHTRQVHRSDIITALNVNIPECSSIDVQFLGDSKYIDEIGDIDCSVINNVTGSTLLSIVEQTYVIPKFSAITVDNTQFDEAIKILVENDLNTWSEI